MSSYKLKQYSNLSKVILNYKIHLSKGIYKSFIDFSKAIIIRKKLQTSTKKIIYAFNII